MVRLRTRTRVSETVKLGPFHFKLRKPLGRSGVRGSVGTRTGRRARLRFGTQRGAGRWGNLRRRWR
jgi:hypothetical protein